MMRRYIVSLTLCLLLPGCLVPGDNRPTPNPAPTPAPATLSRTITETNTNAQVELSKLAATIAAEIRTNNLTAEQQGEAWNKGSAAITGDMNETVGKSVKAALSAATTASAQADVWDEIAKGFRP